MGNAPFNLAILGPTGSGKTAIAHCLADLVPAIDIVSCDSMQVYRRMNIGSAKPSPEKLHRYRYHLVDMREIDETWSLDLFLQAARPLVKALNQGGRSVLLVGGTGLYAKALLYDFKLPKAESAAYREIFAQTQTPEGRERLQSELIGNSGGLNLPRDLLQNPRRLARAVEIVRVQGCLPDGFGSLESDGRQATSQAFRQFIVMPSAAELRQKIRRRTREMLRQGWLEETAELLERGLMNTPTARQVLGYRQVADYLSGRIASRSELSARIEQKTWQYARRQRTWFRHQHPGAWQLTVLPGLDSATVARAIMAASSQSV